MLGGMGTRAPAIGIAAALPLVAVAILGIVLAGRGGPLPVDTAVLDGVVAHRTADRTFVAELISALFGYLGMSVVVAVAGIVVFLRDRTIRAAVAPAVAFAAAMAVTEVIKVAVARPRPPSALRLSLAEQTFSYPSGHAAGACAGLVTAAAVLARTRRSRAVLVACAAVWAIVVAATRVYLGVHWSTDVIAGLLVGSALSILVSALAAAPTGSGTGAARDPVHDSVLDTACGSREPDR